MGVLGALQKKRGLGSQSDSAQFIVRSTMEDCLGRPIPDNFSIGFTREVLAESLWEYGEDGIADAALALGDDDLLEVQKLAVWHHLNDAEPEDGPRLTNARIMARAAIEFVERTGRDTSRQRRRTRRPEDSYLALPD